MRTQLLLIPLLAGLLAACGKSEHPTPAVAPAPAPVAAAPAPAAPVDAAKGAEVFKNTCAMCHQTGVAGAPKLGDKPDWAPRIALGPDLLYKHAIEGFSGDKGAMPAKGGNPSLSDADVKAAVDYIVAQGR
ncbi:MAG: c-type cytochrome [Zoogloea sp.]|uniref:c-type cytochrome n=1 Tax=Zoogloea sp. TaxID=49181 RepID=UPI003F2F89BA